MHETKNARRSCPSGILIGQSHFVVRENQVLAAGVQIEALPQLLHRHRRSTRDASRGGPGPILRLPGSFALLWAFPKSKSRALSFSDSSTSTRAPSSIPEKSFFRVCRMPETWQSEEKHRPRSDTKPFSLSFAINSAIAWTCSVARTSNGCSNIPSSRSASRNAFSWFAVYCWTPMVARGITYDLVVHVGDIHHVPYF